MAASLDINCQRSAIWELIVKVTCAHLGMNWYRENSENKQETVMNTEISRQKEIDDKTIQLKEALAKHKTLEESKRQVEDKLQLYSAAIRKQRKERESK